MDVAAQVQCPASERAPLGDFISPIKHLIENAMEARWCKFRISRAVVNGAGSLYSNARLKKWSCTGAIPRRRAFAFDSWKDLKQN